MAILTQILNQSKPKRFNKNKLPPPAPIYAQFGIALKGSGWQTVKCPFHDDRHASLSVNATHGGFCCHACHAKGDLMGFYMRMTGKDFKTAMVDLGAYE